MPLSSKKAANMFRDDPASIAIPLSEVMRVFGLTWEELRLELAAGKVTACTCDDGYDLFAIPGDELTRWMVATNRTMITRN